MKLPVTLFSICLVLFPLNGFAKGRTLLDRLVLYPTQDVISPPYAERKMLPSGLEIWIHRRPPADLDNLAKKIYLVHFIGNASRAEVEGSDSILLSLFPPEFSIESWAVNYRGFGGSEGKATLKSLSKTGLEVFDAVSEIATDSPIIVSGFSLGTSVALYIATQRKAAGLILRNPVPLREIILGRFGWWNLWLAAGPLSLQIPHELNSIRNAKKSHLPALILQSERDTAIPRHYQDKIVKKYAGEVDRVLLKDCDHLDKIPQSAFSEIRNSLRKLTF